MNDALSLVADKLNNCGAEFSAVSVEGKTYIVFALPYVQLEAPPVGYAFVDSYYVASNRAYFLRKELASLLGEAGFTAVDCKHSYKHLAVASGLGFWLRNTLVASEKFGSRMALEVVGIEGVFADEIALEELYKAPEIAEKCEKCTVCRRLCPRNCIGENGGFCAEKCIRHGQDNGFFGDEEAAKAAGINLWGCDICQRFCPYNKHLETRKMTEKERELFRLDSLFEAFWAGKKGCEPYRDILGSNYLRPTRLLVLTLNAMANSANKNDYISYAEKALFHPDERVKTAAKRVLNSEL
ncbi:MAG: epoxyqueuosine reductase [Clostridia bacterium]|nr:epoxyqueuosine reductase [Clostridia bacterium]